jgi:hypothetical protein
MTAPPTSNHGIAVSWTSCPITTAFNTEADKTTDNTKAAMSKYPLSHEYMLKNGRITRPMTTNDASGSRKIANIEDSLTIYNFLRISSATCSLAMGT